MSNLSADAVKRAQVALASKEAGNELASAVNLAENLSAQDAKVLAAFIVATSTSTTTDFGALKVGDKVLKVKVADGLAGWLSIATAGTLPEAAVIGDTYMVLRAVDMAAAKASAASTSGF